MKYQAILFDLDGTLLPMDNDTFTRGYLTMLAAHMAPRGYDAKQLVSAMWQGVADMVANDGSRRNYDVFWERFASIVGEHCYGDIPTFDTFYENEFKQAISFTSPTPRAKEVVDLAHQRAEKVVLATNPFFPKVAVLERMAWAGLSESDFDLVTHYENSGSCKPNPKYFTEICEKLGLDPADCLMVGNNADEDIAAALAAGLNTFLLDDCLIAPAAIPETPRGSFDDLIKFLE